MSIFRSEDNIIPNKPTIQYHEFNCFQCGFGNRFIKKEDFIDWKKEFDIQRKIYNDMIHDINEAMEFSDRNYSMNPFKDKLIETLTKIRNKYSKEP